MEDLRRLATCGVNAKRWDGEGRFEDFTMKAHLIVVSGDMPAISKVGILFSTFKTRRLTEMQTVDVLQRHQC
jgi:hypothetical protein